MRPIRVRIVPSFPDEVETDLIKQVCRHRGRPQIYVSPFPRFGLSGAKLLLLYFNLEPQGLPFLIKIAGVQDIKREFAAVDRMRDFVQDCRLAEQKIFYSKERAALLYPHLGTDQPKGAETPLSFREVLYCPEHSFLKESLPSCLTEVYAKLHEAHRVSRSEQVSIRQHYNRYFRGNVSKQRIIGILGSQATEESFHFLNTNIYNPLTLIENASGTAELRLSRVHGDLHPDNIILDRNKNPHLVDFAWASEDHDVLVDFVLLENSIRFMHFPRKANLDEQLHVDEVLLDEDGWQLVPSLSFANVEARRIYSRLAVMTGTIRQKARQLLGADFSMRKYLLSQFLILYGLLRYDTYEAYTATRALGMIARRLKEGNS